ncbi:hypothetical protein V5E97_27660 [Singulisphaera sp. Ch08]|uniref:Uncharacterized protein n=1 Tax=Singulisphaera sp. Ch08 TaxID=3120278 RepID=A0AAU7CA27_9BACT
MALANQTAAADQVPDDQKTDRAQRDEPNAKQAGNSPGDPRTLARMLL